MTTEKISEKFPYNPTAAILTSPNCPIIIWSIMEKDACSILCRVTGMAILLSDFIKSDMASSSGFFDTTPLSLREAAKLDGASDARIFFQVVLPMSKPILVYTIISSFMIPWTDFVMAKMILNSGLSADWTVAIGLFNMLQRTLINNYFALFCAGGVLVSVPISILFIIMQKFYVEGITAGADKS